MRHTPVDPSKLPPWNLVDNMWAACHVPRGDTGAVASEDEPS